MISFQNLIHAIKAKTQFSLSDLAKDCDVSLNVLENIFYARYGQSEPKFSDGIILIQYAREKGADLTMVKT